jgi:hypothetical protein
MSLNLIHRIFGKTGGLSRGDIDAYGKSTDAATRQAIEEKVANDPFEADALEGWDGLQYNTGALKSLDKKFASSSVNAWFISGGIGAVAVAGLLTYALWPASTPESNEIPLTAENAPQEEVEITFEESDLIFSEQIEVMVSAPKEEQLAPAEIKQDFVDIEAIRKKDPPMVVADLPVIELSTKNALDLEIIREHAHAKEIYLHDFKLIDYRNYRSRPAVKTRQLILNGVPANLEDEYSEDFETNWKEVEIPYIDFIDKSMRIFGQGNFKRALSRYETILETYSMDVNAHFYAGLCLFNLGEYESGLSHFQSCIDGPYSNFDEEARWMIGSSYEMLGMTAKARTIYEQIAREGGYYAQEAGKKLR